MLSKSEILELNIFSAEIRKATIHALSVAGSGHIGGAMSMVEALAVLYGKIMHVDPENPRMEERDRFVLSKGHCGPSLYAALALKGFFPMKELETLNQGNTILPSHADRSKTPGIDFSTGSLGQGISMAAGSALGARYMGKAYHTYCILGDGECDEGQVWEAVLFCAQQKLDNLTVFVDYNKQQLDGAVDDICRLGDLRLKFEEFGWYVQEVDGHNTAEIYEAVCNAIAHKGQPSMILLHTRKGQGCEYALSQPVCHHLPVTKEIEQAETERLDREIEEMKRGIA